MPRIDGKREIRYSNNVRGKYRAGQRSFGTNWVECDKCGSPILSSDAKVQWNGLVCCPDHWDAKHSGDMPHPIPRPDLAPELIRHSSTIRFRDGTEIRAGQTRPPVAVIGSTLLVNAAADTLLVNGANSDYLLWE